MYNKNYVNSGTFQFSLLFPARAESLKIVENQPVRELVAGLRKLWRFKLVNTEHAVYRERKLR